jgi:hypothetical protein
MSGVIWVYPDSPTAFSPVGWTFRKTIAGDNGSISALSRRSPKGEGGSLSALVARSHQPDIARLLLQMRIYSPEAENVFIQNAKTFEFFLPPNHSIEHLSHDAISVANTPTFSEVF